MINCIVALDNNHGIGRNGQMPWPKLSEDLRWFKSLTKGNVVIMGSTTWASIGSKPLPDRINVVLSRRSHYFSADHTFSDHNTALAFCEEEYPDKDIFIIGGSEIYNAYLNLVDRFYITEIDAAFDCDRKFNLDYVKEKFSNITVHRAFTDPVKYTIKEYRK